MDDSARLLGELFRNIRFGAAIVDRNRRFVLVNPVFAALNGLRPEEHIGQPIDAMASGLASTIAPFICRVLASGERIDSVDMTDASPIQSGAPRHWLSTYTPLRRGADVVGVGVLVSDRTAHADAERALRVSEAQFRAICEASPLGIFLTDLSGSTLYANPALLGHTGLSLEEMLGHGWQRAIHPADLPRVREEFRAAARSRSTYENVHRDRRPDGTVVSVAVKARAISDGEALIGYVGTVEDITARLEAEAALRESELRFRQLAENIGAVFWLTDVKTVHYVSPAFTEIWGRPVEDMLADRAGFLDTIHPEDRAAVEAAFGTWDRPYEYEYRIVRPDGSIRWILDRSFLVRDETGAVVRKAGIATDVTRQKALEAELLQSQKLDSIGRLAGGIAHDFNNLLTVVLTQVKMAARAFEQRGSATEELTQIEEAGMRAAELTRQLLTFARRQMTHPIPLDATEVTAAVVKLLRRIIGEKVELLTQLDPAAGLVRADRTQLEQVLVNLAVNARDAMPDGGTLTIETAPVTRALSADAAPGQCVMLRVSDTGRGIPEQHRAHIFEPFFTTKQPGEGTGLGLATCYGIVKQHGGIIDVESDPRRGTAFCVFLPRIDAQAEAPRSPGRPRAVARGGETVLVVEDDEAVRAVAIQVLGEHGFRVLAASNGLEAVDLLVEWGAQIDLVVTDIVMPELGGDELAIWVSRERPGLPVLFASSHRLTGDPPCERWGFLAKPYVVATLVQRVRELLDE